MKSNIGDNVGFRDIEEKVTLIMKIKSKANAQEESSIKYINDCLTAIRPIIRDNDIALPLYKELRGFRLIPEGNLCLTRGLTAEQENDFPVNIYEIPIDSSYAKQLTPKDIVSLYGSHEFGCMVFAALDKIEKHYEKITNNDERVHANDIRAKALAATAAAKASQ